MPANASTYLGYNIDRCGWVGSLENEIAKDKRLELAIAFYHYKETAPFLHKNVRYYPIFNGFNNKFKKWIFKLNGKIESKKDIKLYLKIVEDFKPDLIHVHGTESPFGLIIPYIKISVVVSIQGNLTVYNKKYFSGVSKSGTLKNLNVYDLLSFKHFIIHEKSFRKMADREKIVLQKAKNILGRTDWDLRITRILSPNSNYYHGDEILRPSFYNNIWESHEKIRRKIAFSTIGDNIYKGFETIWEVVKILENTNNLIWKVAGINANSQIVRVLKQIFNEKIPENIELLGSINEETMICELLNSDIYVHPSHIENSPNSVCEAMILGMPVIATFAGGTGSLLEDKKEGLLIQDGDSYSMAGAILELINNPEKATEYGEKARLRALKRHNPENIKQTLLNIYGRIIEST